MATTNSRGRFHGQAAVITGGNDGIGRATALALAREGARVVIGGRREEQGRRVVDEIRGEGGEAHFVAGDLAVPSQVERLIAAADERFGRLDVLVNNAGVAPVGEMGDQSAEDCDRVLAVNLRAAWLAVRAAVPIMKRNGGGSIVNNASATGLCGFAGVTLYSASKAGLIGVTRSMAIELAPQNIRVNVVAPGVVFTKMTLDAFGSEEIVAQMGRDLHPLGRTARPEEIASVIAFLASSDASLVTGAVVPVDGGLSAK